MSRESPLRMLLESGVGIPMRDGSVPRAALDRPADAGSRPVPLVRNVYGEPALRGMLPVLPAARGRCTRGISPFREPRSLLYYI